MRKLVITALIVAGSSMAFADFGSTSVVNFAGGMTNGGDRSALEGTESLFGAGAQGTPTFNSVAEDFTVTTDFTVTSLCFFMYQTGATAPSMTGLTWGLSAAGGGPVQPSNVGSITNSWWSGPNNNALGVFRTTSTDAVGTTRRLQLIEVDVTDFTLSAGTYWLSWNATGTLASGPWQPAVPTSLWGSGGNNAQQAIGAAGAFAPLVDAGTTQGVQLPFLVKGEAVPEPASMIALGLGALAMVRRRKASK